MGTGFSEEALETLSAALREHALDGPRSYFRVGDSLKPDVWLEPKQARWRPLGPGRALGAAVAAPALAPCALRCRKP